MKLRLRPESFLRGWMLFFCVLLVWTIWARAQGTNGPAGTNAAPKDVSANFARAIKEHAATLTFGLDHIEALQVPVLGNPLWQYLASALYIVLAFFAAKLVDLVIKTRLKAWAKKTDTQWDDVVVDLADGPVKIVLFVILLNVGLQIFDWPDWAERVFSKCTILVVAFSLTYVVMKGIDAAIRLWRKKLPADGDRDFNEQFLLLVGKLTKVVIAVVAILTTLGNIGLDITPALASVSVLGLALGLAAQDTVANLFGAVAVFVDKPFRLGDRIQLAGVDGTVETMGLRATQVRSLEGYLITVPNKNIGNNTVTNITRRPTIRTEINIGLTYDTTADRLKQAAALLEEICRAHPDTHDVVVHFNRFGDFFLNLQVMHWCRQTDWKRYTKTLQELNLTIKQRFDAEGLEFAFPTQTVHHKTPPPAGTPLDAAV